MCMSGETPNLARALSSCAIPPGEAGFGGSKWERLMKSFGDPIKTEQLLGSHRTPSPATPPGVRVLNGLLGGMHQCLQTAYVSNFAWLTAKAAKTSILVL